MIVYHGLPITPSSAAAHAIRAGHAFVSFRHAGQLSLAIECAQSFAIDNGAFSAWMSGEPIKDWTPYYDWCAEVLAEPSCDWAVIPDVIDGDEADNDRLVDEWPHGNKGVPVWHLHESLGRLKRLCAWPRVALGSSGQYAETGTAKWWRRMNEAMRAICDEQGRPRVKLHGLRMLDPALFTKLPLASADSTNIGRNVGIDSHWNGSYTPPNKDVRALVMRSRIESHSAARAWIPQPIQEDFFA